VKDQPQKALRRRTGRSASWKALGRHTRTALAHLRRPRRVTCLDCGFLALAGGEVGGANRVRLGIKGAAGCPPLEALGCSHSLWIDYDLMYSGTDATAIFEELEKDRRQCTDFFRYRPGSSPREHQDLVLKKRDLWQRIVLAVLSWILGFFAAWASRRFGLMR
jgi:hypothetical protein